MPAARFEPPSGYPCDVTVTVENSVSGEMQRAEFPHAQLEQWGEGQGWSDEDYHARMLETMAQERDRSNDPNEPGLIEPD